ncbi:MAG: energy transducer TonB [Bacteroidota bacterium]
MMFNTPHFEAEARRNHRISLVSTIIIMLMFLALSFIWQGLRSLLPPPGEKEYQVIGAVDFGDYKMGSQDINTLEESVEDPSEAPQEQVAAPREVEEAETQPTPAPPITQEEPSPVVEPVKEPAKEKIPTEPETVKPPEPVKDPPKTNDTGKDKQEVKVDDPKPAKNDDKPAGSNQGELETGTGNAGLPDSKEFDDRYSFQWGTSQGSGMSPRTYVDLPFPRYNVQEEGQLTFEFVILPNGRVGGVRLVGLTNKANLKRLGIEAIRKWKFTPLKPGQPQVNQKAQVTISFKLKG